MDCLKSIYSIDSVAVNLPKNFCMKCKTLSTELANLDVTSSYLELCYLLKCNNSAKYNAKFRVLFDWVFWSTNIFVILSERKNNYRSLPMRIKNIQTVNGVLTECKSNYLHVLEEIKRLNVDVYAQITSCFNPFASHVSLQADFFSDLESVLEKVNLVDLSKCRQLLMVDDIKIIDVAEWEVISCLFGQITSFCKLLEECKLPSKN